MSTKTRRSGILMPVFSLPSPYGIGTIGASAREFIDFLKAAGQSSWQMLPVGPISYGDSPYQSFSSYAGNPYYIDLDELINDGLLTEEEVKAADFGQDPEKADYGKLFENRFPLLKKAALRGIPRDRDFLNAFVDENTWVSDYALFMALKRYFNTRPWIEWPEEDIRLHRRDACERWRAKLKEEVEVYEYTQFLFYRQWRELKEYAKKNGIEIIGDLPIYVALDSADVWSEPHWFQLDERNIPTEVAGVPPDYFSSDGQLWGNPLYRWDAMQADGFGWWIRRIAGAGELFDKIRIDHFRGLESYYAIPYGDTTARNGRWVKGPGITLVNTLKNWFPQLDFIAEDLGYATPEVRKLVDDSGFPGMKLLVVAFNPNEPDDFLPHNYTRNCICYTGTHDNQTARGWLRSTSAEELAVAKRYMALNEEEGLVRGVIRTGMGSVADLFIVQMQDWLGLDDKARINSPGIPAGNWTWRMKPGAASEALAEEILNMTKLYGRSTDQ